MTRVSNSRWRYVAVALVVALLAAAAGSVYLGQTRRARRARAAYARSQNEALGLPKRIQSAREAVELEPESVVYRQQQAALLAAAYTQIGALDEARRLLIDAWALDRSNTELRAQLREVNLAIQARDSWKAHVQHQREGPKGELDPEDVIP